MYVYTSYNTAIPQAFNPSQREKKNCRLKKKKKKGKTKEKKENG